MILQRLWTKPLKVIDRTYRDQKMPFLRPRFGQCGSKGYLAAALFLTTWLTFVRSAEAGAEECTNAAGLPLQPQDISARLQFLRASLRETARLERRYAIGWNLTYLGFAAGTWTLLPFSDDPQGQRKASAWNSATSLFASLQVLIDPLLVVRDHRRMEALVKQPSALKDCTVLHKAELLLQHAANSETSARSAKAHIFSFLTTIGLGLVLGYALERPDSAAINTTIGITLGEIMIATRPTAAIRQWQDYRNGNLRLTAPREGFALRVLPFRTNDGYGVAIGGSL